MNMLKKKETERKHKDFKVNVAVTFEAYLNNILDTFQV